MIRWINEWMNEWKHVKHDKKLGKQEHKEKQLFIIGLRFTSAVSFKLYSNIVCCFYYEYLF